MAVDSMSSRPPENRAEFWTRFFWGALFGLVVSFGFCLESEIHALSPWLIIPVCSVLFGLVASWFGDRFWYMLGRLFGW